MFFFITNNVNNVVNKQTNPKNELYKVPSWSTDPTLNFFQQNAKQ